MFSALTDSLKTELTWASVRSNVLAGLTVGIIALPLSMALAIASGVPPQHGLYTAMIAGIVIALTGGSRVNISGPTAAFVVVLLPIVQQHGLGGLLVSGMMAGAILLLLGLARMGSLIEVVPYPVTVGFTAGIGVVIATLQLKDFLGLEVSGMQGHFVDKLTALLQALPSVQWNEALIGMLTFAVLWAWPRLHSRIPGHLVALLLATVVAWLLGWFSADYSVATIGSRFHYEIGVLQGNGIPPVLPSFAWPWQQPGPDGQPVGLSFELINNLLGAAMAIAILGALESLLCAVVADGLSGKKHAPNDELIGQGIGNMLVPFFGGIPATAAIARTAANVRAGGSWPLAAVVHGLFILLAILVLAPLLAYIPMAAMAALLIMVAWNMSEARHFVRTLRIAPREDILTLLTCFSLTVLFDMAIAVGVGMGLAAMLFIRRNILLTDVRSLQKDEQRVRHPELPPEILIYDINGPLFFGTAQKALKSIASTHASVRAVILDMTDVSMLDMTAIIAMESIVGDFRRRNIGLVINNLQPRMMLKLERAGLLETDGQLAFACDLDEAASMAAAMLK